VTPAPGRFLPCQVVLPDDCDARYEAKQAWISANLQLVGDRVRGCEGPHLSGALMLIARQGVPAGLFTALAGEDKPQLVYCHPTLASSARPYLEHAIAQEEATVAANTSNWSKPEERVTALRTTLRIADAMIAATEHAYQVIDLRTGRPPVVPAAEADAGDSASSAEAWKQRV
jgi:hypothetical protein